MNILFLTLYYVFGQKCTNPTKSQSKSWKTNSTSNCFILLLSPHNLKAYIY